MQRRAQVETGSEFGELSLCSAWANCWSAWKSNSNGWARSAPSIPFVQAIFPVMHTCLAPRDYLSSGNRERCSKHKSETCFWGSLFPLPKADHKLLSQSSLFSSQQIPGQMETQPHSQQAVPWMPLAQAQCQCPWDKLLQSDMLLRMHFFSPSQLLLHVENAHGKLQWVENKGLLHLEPYGSHIYTIHNKQHIFQSGAV